MSDDHLCSTACVIPVEELMPVIRMRCIRQLRGSSTPPFVMATWEAFGIAHEQYRDAVSELSDEESDGDGMKRYRWVAIGRQETAQKVIRRIVDGLSIPIMRCGTR